MTEVDGPMFTNATEDEWTGLKRKILTASSSLWVTKGNLLAAAGQELKPEHAMIVGLASAFRSESKSLKFLTADLEELGKNTTVQQSEIFEDLAKLADLAENHVPEADCEFRSSGGLVHVPRLVKDDNLNAEAQSRKEGMTKVDLLPCSEVAKEAGTFQFALEKPGAVDSVHLEGQGPSANKLGSEDCEIEVRRVRLLTSQLVESVSSGESLHPSGGEYFGIVTSVGDKVKILKPGDSVFGITFGKLGNVIREKADFMYKVEAPGSELAQVS